jgi:hypothetical protein
MEPVVGERLDERVGNQGGAGRVRIGISNGDETRACVGIDFAMRGEDSERGVTAIGRVGEGH